MKKAASAKILTLICSLFLLSSHTSFADAVPPGEGNPVVWDDHYRTIYDPEVAWDVGGSVLTYVLLLPARVERLSNRIVVITSHHRPKGSPHSQHYLGGAVDFYFDYAEARDACDVWTWYKEDLEDILRILEEDGIDDRVGFGLYHKKIFHLDFRGTRARWGFNEYNKQIGFDELRGEIDEWIDAACNSN